MDSAAGRKWGSQSKLTTIFARGFRNSVARRRRSGKVTAAKIEEDDDEPAAKFFARRFLA
jgi:hypothetical protein